MKLSEIDLMIPALCKHGNKEWSAIFEVTKLSYSKNQKAVYVRVITGMEGQSPQCHHCWRDATELDNWEVFDLVYY
jgi:hypothetical protein